MRQKIIFISDIKHFGTPKIKLIFAIINNQKLKLWQRKNRKEFSEVSA